MQLTQIINGAFGSAGERCMASALLLQLAILQMN